METGLRHLHSVLAIAILIGLLLSVVLAILNKKADNKLRKIAKFTMIFLHTQFTVGLVLYFISAKGFASLSAEAMSSPVSRLYALEHPLIGILAIILVTVGHIKSKKVSDEAAAKSIAIYYVLGLILILTRIPWQTWSILQ